ncbi:MAG: DNA polymerase III subunit gamma/tau [Crocinitomicaceae bacterium]|nr:DNA polymerase III subunit gamma/tau [Crocinitomicaceae bacterium]
MDTFVVSARKYRPQTFNTVVGQESITTTLQNAIQNNHLAQAFLFCGSRGVGKTTTARILAKTINQDGNENPEEDFAFNIFELDAASNNSVDDIRNLIDQVRIPPQVGKYKVYIIDEVHMLSQAAFNAFLKTLEEPPKHAIFILATTEKHKILPTILSRCQIFDFHRIKIHDIVNHLKSIAEKESIKYEEKALHIIAQKADGGLRDALSIFDQIVSFTNNNITYDAVLENLNVLDYDYYFKIVDNALNNEIHETLGLYNDVLSKGFEGAQFMVGLAEHLRNLLICLSPKTSALLEVPSEIEARFGEQAARTNTQFLLLGLDLWRDTEMQYKGSIHKRLTVEIALMKLCSINKAQES